MQFPNPTSHYSIDLPQDVQDQIQSLNVVQLKDLIGDIAVKIANGVDDPFSTSCLGEACDDLIEDRLENTNDWLGFMQWVLDGLKQAVN